MKNYLSNLSNLSLYIHYPFCKSKCPYCDFNSYCNLNVCDDKLLCGYLTEIEYYKNVLQGRNIETIYFGGGTPSLMKSEFLAEILNKIAKIGNISNSCEISMEANPNSIDFDKLVNFKKIGINRLSIGVQSLFDKDLKMLGRIHSREQALEAISFAQKVFCDRYSIDMIYTRPSQNIEEWKDELFEAIKLSPYHLSLYQLIVEKGTPFSKNKIKLPNEDLSVNFYNVTRDILETNNLSFYEISNYARPGYECRHNVVYWTNGEWLGIGAGAHSRLNFGLKRYSIQNIKNPINWLKKVNEKSSGVSVKKQLTEQEIIEEFVLMGLRIKDGIKIENLQKNAAVKNFYDILNKDGIDLLVKNNLIEATETQIKIKKSGFLLLNSIIEKLIK